MIFGKYLLGPLMDQAGEGNGSGGSGPEPGQPVTGLPDFKALFGDLKNDLKKELLKDFETRVNGINTETRKQFKTLSDGFTTLKTDFETRFKPAEPASGEPEPHVEPTPTPGATGANNGQSSGTPAPDPKPTQQPKPQKDPALAAVERQLADLKREREQEREALRKERELADSKDRAGTLRMEVSKYKIADEVAAEDFFSVLFPKVQRSEETGELFGPDGKALADFVRGEYERRPTLKPVVRVNGAGAPPPTYVGGRQYTTEDITSGKLSPTEFAEATRQVAALLPKQ